MCSSQVFSLAACLATGLPPETTPTPGIGPRSLGSPRHPVPCAHALPPWSPGAVSTMQCLTTLLKMSAWPWGVISAQHIPAWALAEEALASVGLFLPALQDMLQPTAGPLPPAMLPGPCRCPSRAKVEAEQLWGRSLLPPAGSRSGGSWGLFAVPRRAGGPGAAFSSRQQLCYLRMTSGLV